jgi:hypothetical protein
LAINGTAITATAAELNIMDGVTSTAAEINLLATLDRGSIIYGNSSGATTVLGQGSNGYVLTSDGTDISWAAAAGGSVSGDTFAVDLKIGRDADNLVDFATTDNKLIFRVEGVNEVELVQNALSPITNDGVALGTTSLGWSDLFLADAGTVTFGNDQDIVLAHVADKGLTLSSAASAMPEFTLKNTNNDALGGRLIFDKNGASAADNDVLGAIDWTGENDAGSPETIIYGAVVGSSIDVSDGSEDGMLTFNTMVDGTATSQMFIGNGRVTISGPVGSGDAPAAVLEMNTIEQTIVDGDVLGRIEFKAVLESSGTDAVLVGAAIQAEASDTFAADNNKTDLVFKTGASEAAQEKMRLDSGIPKLTIGSGVACDTMLVFDGNAQDFRLGIDDGTDKMEFGVGAAHGTTPAMAIAADTSIEIFDTLSINPTITDEKVSGITFYYDAGEDLERGEAVYFNAQDSKMWKAVATVAGTSRCVALAAEDISANAVGKFLLQGFIRDNGSFPAYTVGATLYTPEAETDSQNVPEEVAPDTDGDFVQVLGWAVTADMIYFNPSNDIIEVA